jgi:two-component system sensor histidine kinase/response regulator
LFAALVDRKPGALRRLVANALPLVGLAPSRPVAEDAPRVLVVDDSDVNRRVAERMLARLGYRSESSASGLVALNLLALSPYAAVLMDCRMPDMDGFTATAEIRREERGVERTPIIAMTANAQHGERERCLAAGMDDYLPKPLQMAELERALTHWISSSPAAPLAWPGAADASSPAGVLDSVVLAQLHAFEEPGEVSLLTELIEAFRGSAPRHMASLKAALGAGDATAFADAAHVLKGSAATLGAARVRLAAHDLEVRGLDHDLLEAEVQVVALEAACTEAIEALKREDVCSRLEAAA